MKANDTDIIKRIDGLCQEQEAEALSFLEELVNHNSLTANWAGIAQNAEIISRAATEHGLAFEPVPRRDNCPGAVHLVHRGCFDPGEPFFGLVGHFDTVHGPESGFDRLRSKGHKLHGPGVQDMKSGVVASLYSLVVLKKLLDREVLPVKVVYNCDEEIGSPDSRALIETEMAGASAVFVFEGRHAEDRALVTARKGIMMGGIETRGKASHAGEAPQQGASAVLEMAHKVIGLSALNNPGLGDTVTVGRIKGGEVANQIPALCRADLDVRFANPERGEALEKAIAGLMARRFVPGVETGYHLETARPPFVKTAESQMLFDAYRAAAGEFGEDIGERSSGGGSDANLTGAMGIPTLDGLGPVGGGPHTDHEYIESDSLTASIKAFVLMMAKLMN